MISIDTKAGIDRLGNSIRLDKNQIKEENLISLQKFRTSHKETISELFSFLCSISSKVHPQTIVTYRIKRFESIISKLNRYPNMRLSRMWDIGGCRCITRNNKDVYKFKKFISESPDFLIVKENDYILEPQNDGYKSLHIFVKKRGGSKTIEVQLRSQKDHNWATLVEISDLLFGVKLKELGENVEGAKSKDLFKLHLLLSRIENITNNERKEIAQILIKYEYFEKLSEVFSRNFFQVRKQWFQIENRSKHKFFLIETSKDEIPRILSFESSIKAEIYYYDVYRSDQDTNRVLIHLRQPNYKQIGTAYSNYILTFHSFLDECLLLIENLILESLNKGKYLEYRKMFNLYNSLVFHHIVNLNSEITGLNDFSKNIINKKNKINKKGKEWIEDINIQIRANRERTIKFRVKLNKNSPINFAKRIIFYSITKQASKRLNKKIKKELNSNI